MCLSHDWQTETVIFFQFQTVSRDAVLPSRSSYVFFFLSRYRMGHNKPVSYTRSQRCHNRVLHNPAAGIWHCVGICFCSFSQAARLSKSLIYS